MPKVPRRWILTLATGNRPILLAARQPNNYSLTVTIADKTISRGSLQSHDILVNEADGLQQPLLTVNLNGAVFLGQQLSYSTPTIPLWGWIATYVR